MERGLPAIQKLVNLWRGFHAEIAKKANSADLISILKLKGTKKCKRN